jgi:hypothetical protein
MTRRHIGRVILPATLAIVTIGAGYRVASSWPEIGSAIEFPSMTGSPEAGSVIPAERVALSLPPIEEFRVIVERPLFSPSRRPPLPAPPPEPELVAVEAAVVEPVAQPEPPPPPAISFSLIGIVMFGDQRVALLQPLDGARAVQLREGEEFGGWTAALIEKERAVFRSAYSEEELKLDFRSPTPPGFVPAQSELPPPAPIDGQAQ